MNYFKIYALLLFVSISIVCSCQSKSCTADCCNKATSNKASKTVTMSSLTKEREIACKLTTPELQKRRESVLASLKSQVLEKHELETGYKYKFASADPLLDELVTFIKTERQCCDFFTFSLLVSGDDEFTWLSITGPKGAKEFIKTEMEL